MPRNMRTDCKNKLMETLSSGKRYKFPDLLSAAFSGETPTDKDEIWLRQFLSQQCKAGNIQHEGREYFMEKAPKKRERKKKVAETAVEKAIVEEAITEPALSPSGNHLFHELTQAIDAFYDALEKAYDLQHNPALYSGLSPEKMEYTLESVRLVGDLYEFLGMDEDEEDDDDDIPFR